MSLGLRHREKETTLGPRLELPCLGAVPANPSAIGANRGGETRGEEPALRDKRRIFQRVAEIQSESTITWSTGKKPQSKPGNSGTGCDQFVEIRIERSGALASRAKHGNRQRS